ncbi:phage tail protein [Caulobacter mirabilis]|uniref:Microcystin-dependent protein n=1 Tax=Caulobacter mirabilis TaxID=69666 RepID=A0A2D2B1I2_9CAUL|nr:tail fiber protein [Caulobacter mirabilis]ATQ44121.1 microcystin-dependent protein [Caulobacter mirabilis]
MTEPFIGEIQLFGFPFAPAKWATCSGQLIPIQQNTALFSLLGTQYGGNGTTNFALPNFGQYSPDNQGQGPGLTPRTVGEMVGTPTVTLLQNEMPAHTHTAQIYMARGVTARVGTPQANSAPSNPTAAQGFVTTGAPDTVLSPMTLAMSGGGLPHENSQPYLTVNFSIALQGVFPSFG